MSEADWTYYVGVVGGAIGTITGIFGTVTGYIAYQRSKAVRSRDLRLELRKAASDLRDDIAGLSATLPDAEKAHSRAMAALGEYQSGNMERWRRDWQTDCEALASLESKAGEFEGDLEALSESDLESGLVRVHALRKEAERLHVKYQAARALDAKRLDERWRAEQSRR